MAKHSIAYIPCPQKNKSGPPLPPTLQQQRSSRTTIRRTSAAPATHPHKTQKNSATNSVTPPNYVIHATSTIIHTHQWQYKQRTVVPFKHQVLPWFTMLGNMYSVSFFECAHAEYWWWWYRCWNSGAFTDIFKIFVWQARLRVQLLAGSMITYISCVVVTGASSPTGFQALILAVLLTYKFRFADATADLEGSRANG